MLSFKALSEKKTKVKINPKQSEITEKNGKCNHSKKGLDCPMHGMDTCPDTENGEGADMSEAKKKDDSYLEVNFKKRQKNNEKARKEMDKVPGQKNPHFESTGDQAYGSQEEVSEESTEEVAETETKLLTFGQFDELYKGKHGQSEKEYQDGRSQGGKMVSGDSKGSGAKYSHGRRVDDGGAGPQPAGGSKKPKAQGKMDRGGRAELQMRKANLKKEEVVNEEGADSLKDRRMERGGVGGNQRYNKPVSNTPNTFGKKKPKYDGMSALDKVKAKIEKQYGKGAIMDTKKKK